MKSIYTLRTKDKAYLLDGHVDIITLDTCAFPVLQDGRYDGMASHESADRLIQIYLELPEQTRQSAVIVKACLLRPGTTEDIENEEHFETCGFDVVTEEEGYLSAIYMGILKKEAGIPFKQELNDMALFDTVDEARKFASLAEQTVPEHKPFVIASLWRYKGGC